jgi:hypothetical protein
VDQAAAHGGALVLSGDPGSGKSLLVEQAVERAVLPGCGAACRTGRSSRPTWPSRAGPAAAAARREIAELEPAQCDPLRWRSASDSGTPPSRAAVADAVLALLTDMSVRTGVVVVVDDAQWLDRGTAGALAAVAKRVAGHRIGVLAAMRTGATSFFDPSGLPVLEIGAAERRGRRAARGHRAPRHGRSCPPKGGRGPPPATRWRWWSCREPSCPPSTPARHRYRRPCRSDLDWRACSRPGSLPSRRRPAGLLLLAALERSGDVDV